MNEWMHERINNWRMNKERKTSEWMNDKRINNKWKGYILYVRINELKWRTNV